MRFELEATDREILDLVRTFARDRAPLAVDRESGMRTPYREMGELGLFGVSVTQALGGLGLGPLGAGLVAQGLGRELFPGPWLEHMLAVQAAATLGAADAWLADLLSGRVLCGHLAGTAAQAISFDSAASTVTGTVRAPGAVDAWTVVVGGAGAEALLRIRRSASGVTAVALESVDVVWPVDELRLDAAPVEVLHDFGGGPSWLEELAGLLAAAYALGATERLLELTTAYVKDREQFGRPIGAFQAVKHRLADVFIAIEHVRPLVLAALAADDERSRLAPLAKIEMDRVYRMAAETALQFHGGVGFTWESPVQLFLKNALRLGTYPRPHTALLGAIKSELAIA